MVQCGSIKALLVPLLVGISTTQVAGASDEFGSISKFNREERSIKTLFKTGRAALHGLFGTNLILVGTHLLKTFKGDTGIKRIYSKLGGGKIAKEDFYSVQPRNVKVDEMSQLHTGDLGNRHIALDLHGAFGVPMITITKHNRNGKIIDEIRYLNQDLDKGPFESLHW